MPLHIEPLVNDIIAQVRSALPTQLASVAAATDTSLALTAPPTERYYIGEPNRYSSYNAPSIFVITETTDLPLTNSDREWHTLLNMEHRVLLDCLVEERDETRLTKACWRYAQALVTCLHGLEIAPSTTTTRSEIAWVRKIDYGVLFTNTHKDQRIFRKDVVIELLIQHKDLLTPLP